MDYLKPVALQVVLLLIAIRVKISIALHHLVILIVSHNTNAFIRILFKILSTVTFGNDYVFKSQQSHKMYLSNAFIHSAETLLNVRYKIALIIATNYYLYGSLLDRDLIYLLNKFSKSPDSILEMEFTIISPTNTNMIQTVNFDRKQLTIKNKKIYPRPQESWTEMRPIIANILDLSPLPTPVQQPQDSDQFMRELQELSGTEDVTD